jgi:hypothetical protein
MNAKTTELAKSINNLSASARIELLNFHIANGNAQVFLIDGRENVRLTLPTGQVAVVVV